MVTVHLYGIACATCGRRIHWAATDSGSGVQADQLHAYLAAHQGHTLGSFHVTRAFTDDEIGGTT